MLQTLKSHTQWPQVLKILQTLREKEFVAWLAGGCVRDALMKRMPRDFDVATNATPEEVLTLFPGALELGKSFGVIVVPFEGFQVEIATFRSDGQYQDGRHPEAVEFSSPEMDAQRRDFTVNALFFDYFNEEVKDFVGGIDDLQEQTIRCVGEPLQRFREDQLRLLRGVRFAGQLNFNLESETWKAIRGFDSPLRRVSRERVIAEMEKLLSAPHAVVGLDLLYDSPLLDDVFQQVKVLAKENRAYVFRAISEIVNYEYPLKFRWALFLFCKNSYDFQIVKNWVHHQPFSKVQKAKLLGLVELCFEVFYGEMSIEQLVVHLGKHKFHPFVFDFLSLIERMLGESPQIEISSLWEMYTKNIDNKGDLVAPLLTGDDLLGIGMQKGPQLGDLLQKMYHLQLRNNIRNKDEIFNHPDFQAYTSKVV